MGTLSGAPEAPATRCQRWPQSVERQSPVSVPAKMVRVVTTGPDSCAEAIDASRIRTNVHVHVHVHVHVPERSLAPLRSVDKVDLVHREAGPHSLELGVARVADEET